MKTYITFKGLEKTEKKQLRALMDRAVGQLDRKMGPLADGDSSLRALVQKHGNRTLYRLGMTLHLPRRRTIAVHDQGEDPVLLLNEAFAELTRRLEKVKSLLRNEHLWKRKSRRRQLRSTPAPEAQATAPAAGSRPEPSWFAQVTPFLPELADFAHREITYLQCTGDLLPADLQPAELVDSTLLEAFDHLEEKPPELDLKAWLFHTTVRLLDQETDRSRTRQQQVSMEEVIPDEDIDEHIYDFYQPDEVLRVEDLIGVADHLPEAEAARMEAIQKTVQPALARLPHTWRRAALLHHMIGFSQEVAARILGLPPAELRQALQNTTAFMEACLRQRGNAVVSLEVALQGCRRLSETSDQVASEDASSSMNQQ